MDFRCDELLVAFGGPAPKFQGVQQPNCYGEWDDRKYDNENLQEE